MIVCKGRSMAHVNPIMFCVMGGSIIVGVYLPRRYRAEPLQIVRFSIESFFRDSPSYRNVCADLVSSAIHRRTAASVFFVLPQDLTVRSCNLENCSSLSSTCPLVHATRAKIRHKTIPPRIRGIASRTHWMRFAENGRIRD